MTTIPGTAHSGMNPHTLHQQTSPNLEKESSNRAHLDAFLNDTLIELRQAEHIKPWEMALVHY